MVSVGGQPSRLSKLVMLLFLSLHISAFAAPSVFPRSVWRFSCSLSVAFPGAGSPFAPDTKALLRAAGS